ncbi:MAG: hypothetical protein ACI89D_000219 [Bermanella sp.]|jgi:hypothetical protein
MINIDWPQQVFDPQWQQQLEKHALRRFIEPITADEACSFVLDKLSEDEWARCKTFKGQAKPGTFLYSLSARLFEECSRQRYGRARPPVWLQQQGDFWIRLWKSICLERNSTSSVIDKLCRNGRFDTDIVKNIIRTIKARLPWCGVSHLPIPAEFLSADGEELSLLDANSAGDSLEDALARNHLRETLATLAALLDDAESLADIEADTIARARQALSLDDESLLMLKLHFQEGLSFSAIARALGVPNHQPGRQIKRSLGEIHAALEQAGLDVRSAADALEDLS